MIVSEKSKFEFVAKMARQCPDAPLQPMIEAVRLLLLYSKQHGKMQEDKCNRPWTDRDQANEDETERLIRGLVQNIPGVTGVIFSGDPRGNTVKLTLATGYTDDFGNEGLCIPQ